MNTALFSVHEDVLEELLAAMPDEVEVVSVDVETTQPRTFVVIVRSPVFPPGWGNLRRLTPVVRVVGLDKYITWDPDVPPMKLRKT